MKRNLPPFHSSILPLPFSRAAPKYKLQSRILLHVFKSNPNEYNFAPFMLNSIRNSSFLTEPSEKLFRHATTPSVTVCLYRLALSNHPFIGFIQQAHLHRADAVNIRAQIEARFP